MRNLVVNLNGFSTVTGEQTESPGISSQDGNRELFSYFNHWVDAVMLFVFGFIIHEICKHLSNYYKEKKIKELEKEIWVSAQWGILINRTLLKA